VSDEDASGDNDSNHELTDTMNDDFLAKMNAASKAAKENKKDKRKSTDTISASAQKAARLAPIDRRTIPTPDQYNKKRKHVDESPTPKAAKRASMTAESPTDSKVDMKEMKKRKEMKEKPAKEKAKKDKAKKLAA
jgi:hypothetical protein